MTRPPRAAAICGATAWNSTSHVILSISAVVNLHAIEQNIAGTTYHEDDGATSDIRFSHRWSDWKNGIYIGSVAIGVLLPLFFFVVRP